jgi:L-aminopeptidase/D-esterase-like protein
VTRFACRIGALTIVIAGTAIGSASVEVGAQAPGSTSSSSSSSSSSTGITAVPGIRVGQVTLSARPTGCTVVLAPPNAVGAVDVRGGAPGTRETDVLRPDNTVQMINAVVLAGGSAYGLDAATGVMTYLEEQKVGYPVGSVVVPIVPAAILFDLNVGGHPEIRPDAACGYQAAAHASNGVVAEGSVGAGAGATVGKLAGLDHAMKGGLGTSAIRGPGGLIVGAIVAVNAAGSIVDPRTGKAVAGVRTADGHALEDPFALVRGGRGTGAALFSNTTIGVVATNARLTKAQALRVAEMAHDGLARAIVPSHTPSDGDTIFVIATAGLSGEPDVSTIGQLAAESVTDAILRGVRLATALPGFPAASDIK